MALPTPAALLYDERLEPMSEEGPFVERQDVEDLWRGRLAAAKVSYEFAVARFRTASEDFRAQQIPGSDGSFSVHLAIAEESSARKEYMRVLRVFTDLLLNGKIPGGVERDA